MHIKLCTMLSSTRTAEQSQSTKILKLNYSQPVRFQKTIPLDELEFNFYVLFHSKYPWLLNYLKKDTNETTRLYSVLQL